MVAAAGIPVVDVPFVTVGGGIGSFVTVDYLRIAGVPTDRIRVLSDIDFPWQTYEYSDPGVTNSAPGTHPFGFRVAAG